MNNLSLLTFNIECSKYQTRHEKINQLLEFIRYKKIDCICLQDVNTTSLSIIKSKLGSYNAVEGLGEEKMKTSQVTLLNNSIKILEEYSYDMPSLESKEILGCRIIWNGKEIEIINVHLEESNETYREKQIDTIYEISKEDDNYVIVGDFNIDSMSDKANIMITNNKKFTDAWISSGCVTCLRNTTFINDKWSRSSRLFYVKSVLNCMCTGLLNFNSNKSIVTFSISQ